MTIKDKLRYESGIINTDEYLSLNEGLKYFKLSKRMERSLEKYKKARIDKFGSKQAIEKIDKDLNNLIEKVKKIEDNFVAEKMDREKATQEIKKIIPDIKLIYKYAKKNLEYEDKQGTTKVKLSLFNMLGLWIKWILLKFGIVLGALGITAGIIYLLVKNVNS